MFVFLMGSLGLTGKSVAAYSPTKFNCPAALSWVREETVLC